MLFILIESGTVEAVLEDGEPNPDSVVTVIDFDYGDVGESNAVAGGRRALVTPKPIDLWRGRTPIFTPVLDDFDESETCRTCGADLADDAGEGWDGECGNCADKRSAS